jgi:hypothetical protein
LGSLTVPAFCPRPGAGRTAPYPPDKAERRVKAMDLVNRAINEVQAGIVAGR